jgi:hypothetical protein
MINLIAVAVAVTIALLVAWVLKKRKPEPPTQGGYHIPTQIDRADFPEHQASWLVAVFSSATCDACAGVLSKAMVLACEEVNVVKVEFQTDKVLHERYKIDAVPTLVVVDESGVVCAGFIGPITAQDLWAAVAECRDPGSTPEPHLGHDHDE